MTIRSLGDNIKMMIVLISGGSRAKISIFDVFGPLRCVVAVVAVVVAVIVAVVTVVVAVIVVVAVVLRKNCVISNLYI